jgi:hypothetical protein
MTDPEGPQNPEEQRDVVAKYGMLVVVVVTCFLAGDALPTVVKNGMDPQDKFVEIVTMTLPYTIALTLALLVLVTGRVEFPGNVMIFILILLVGFLLASTLHWGITDADVARVNDEIQRRTHPSGSPPVTGVKAVFIDVAVLIQRYLTKYGAPLFIGGTLAAMVMSWKVKTWLHRESHRPPKQESKPPTLPA